MLLNLFAYGCLAASQFSGNVDVERIKQCLDTKKYYKEPQHTFMQGCRVGLHLENKKLDYIIKKCVEVDKTIKESINNVNSRVKR